MSKAVTLLVSRFKIHCLNPGDKTEDPLTMMHQLCNEPMILVLRFLLLMQHGSDQRSTTPHRSWRALVFRRHNPFHPPTGSGSRIYDFRLHWSTLDFGCILSGRQGRQVYLAILQFIGIPGAAHILTTASFHPKQFLPACVFEGIHPHMILTGVEDTSSLQ